MKIATTLFVSGSPPSWTHAAGGHNETSIGTRRGAEIGNRALATAAKMAENGGHPFGAFASRFSSKRCIFLFPFFGRIECKFGEGKLRKQTFEVVF